MQGDLERVRQLNQHFYDALSNQNLLTMDQLWSHSAHVRCVHPGGHMLEGWESIRDSWRDFFKKAICLTVKPEGARITVLGPTAIVTCHETISSFTLEGSMTSEVATTNIFEKKSGEWRLILHHASLLQPRATDAEAE